MENAQFSRVRCRAVPPPAGPDAGSAPPAPRHVLTCLLNNRNGAHLSLWELGPDGLLTMCGAGRVAESPGTCLDVSADGALAVVGTSEGDVVVGMGWKGLKAVALYVLSVREMGAITHPGTGGPLLARLH